MDSLLRTTIPGTPLPDPSGIAGSTEVSETYLQDESRMHGSAEKVLFPACEDEIASIVAAAEKQGEPLTCSGARTGITGGAVPSGGWLVSLEKMNRISGMGFDEEAGEFFLVCQPGVTLENIQHSLENLEFEHGDSWSPESLAALERLRKSGKWFFPPDPTEKSASLGGMVACNASGARTFHYGPTRDYTRRIRTILPGPRILDLKRNSVFAGEHGEFAMEIPGGETIKCRIPDYKMPPVKNAAGYFSAPGMDMIDLFIGAEGTLGIFSEIEIRLVPAPREILGVASFFGSEQDALSFVHALRGDDPDSKAELESAPLAIEYFDANSLNLLRAQKEKLGAASGIPALDESFHTAVYTELPTTSEGLEETALPLLELLEVCGSDADKAWTATTDQETEQLKAFRHALPEAVNQRIGERAAKTPGLTKLGTDFAVPDNCLDQMIQAYRETLDAAGFEYVLFGHIGNNHVHVNILPRDIAEYNRGKEIYVELARRAVELGGTVSGEHGLGKLKKNMLSVMYGDQAVEQMMTVKKTFDPQRTFNPGNLFDET